MKVQIKEINNFLKDMTYGMSYTLLEESKDAKELEDVGKRHNLRLPCKDLAVFKGIYAFVNETNNNGCKLPKKEVEKALDTLNGKSVDFDHLRKKIVGYWLEGSITKKDEIQAYGIFFKGSLHDEYEELKTMLKEGNLKISFEAWGSREFTKGEEEYDLVDIEFAGGALLLNTKPAFPGATVLEISHTENFIRNLETGEAVSEAEKRYLERARFYISDMNSIMTLLDQVDCPHCKEKYTHLIDNIDFKGGSVDTTCVRCEGRCHIKMTPKAKKMENYASIEKIEIIKSNKTNIDSEENKIMEKELNDLKAEVASLKAKVTTLETEKTDLTNQLATATATITAKETEKAEAIKIASENATKIANRKSELGEFAKDIKDEELLDDKNYEIAKLKKENAELKAKKVETASTTTVPVKKEETQLATGTKKEVVAEKIDTTKINPEKIQEFAFGKSK